VGQGGWHAPLLVPWLAGVLEPHSNAHGPNELLHIPTGKLVTAAVARVIAAQHVRPKGWRRSVT
jgi:hypothetical protein